MTFIKITTKITILACILDHFLCVRHVCAANYCLTKFMGQKKRMTVPGLCKEGREEQEI